MNNISNSESKIPINQPITQPGTEFIYLASAENENDLDVLRCANQVHFKSYSSKNGWTKYECARSSAAQGKCKFRLLAAGCDPNNIHTRFNIYSYGVHNHEIEPIVRTSSMDVMSIDKNLVVNKSCDINLMTNNSCENSILAELLSSKQPSVNDIKKKFPLFKIYHSFNDLECFRRSEGLLVYKQFNLVNGIPEIIYYRCKMDLQCSFTFQALYNNNSGFFELYAPLKNVHFHSSNDPTASNINNTLANGDLQQNNNIEGLLPCSSNIQNGDLILKRRLINVNLNEWNYIGTYNSEEDFEKLRVQRQVSPLRERGKQFSTLRQQTLKCYHRKPEKGKCRYRILIFREWDGQPVKVYEKGVHNHKASKPKQIDLIAIQQAQQYYEKFPNSFIQQNSTNKNNSIFPQQQNCYPILHNLEETNGKLNSDLEHSWGENGMNFIRRFSLTNCYSELKVLANGFMMDLTCNEESMVFKRRDNQNTFLIVTECGNHKEGLNVEECQNGCFSDHSEQWIKGDKAQFIRAMRTRIHEFIEEKSSLRQLFC